MIALYIIGGIVFLLVLILLCPISFRILYQDDFIARLKILGIPFCLYPKKEKQSKIKEKSSNQVQNTNKKVNKNSKNNKNKKSKTFLKDKFIQIKNEGFSAIPEIFNELWEIIKNVSIQVAKSIKIRKLKFHIYVGGEDSAQIALLYGNLCSTVLPTISLIETMFKTSKTDVEIKPLFLNEKTLFDCDVVIYVIPWRLIVALIILINSKIFKNQK